MALESTQLREGAAGTLAFVTGVLLAGISVLQGHSLVFAQLTSPILAGILWPVSFVGAAIVTVGVMVILLAVALESINILGTPLFFDRTEYTLVGAGGLIGTFAAVSATILDSVTSLTVLGGGSTYGTIGSTIALTTIALPTGYVFYKLWKPNVMEQLYRPDSAASPNPEFVRTQRTTVAETSLGDNEIASIASTPEIGGQSSERKHGPSTTEERASPKKQIDFSELEFQWNTNSGVSLEDVGGMDDLKEEIRRDVIKPLTTGKERAKELQIPVPNLLFHGPPGTGKTFISKALATELSLPFAQLSGADIQSKWINESAQKVNTLFEEAKSVAASEGGAVVFVDELDSVLSKRDGDGNSHAEDNKTTNEFLNHLQDCSDHDIVFIGATNRPDDLDEASVRAGRFDKKIYIGQPDKEARAAVLRAHLSDRPNRLEMEHIDCVAEATEGLVAADLKEIVISAARESAFGREDNQIRWEDIRVAVNEIRSSDMTESRR